MREEIKARQKKAKTWDGKPEYSDVDFTGVNLQDSLTKEEEERKK